MTDRQCLLRSPEAIAYCDRYCLLVVDRRTIGRTRGRAINNDWRRSMARSIMGSDLKHSTSYNVCEQSICGATGRKVARPVLNMTVDLVATHLSLSITHDPCDQSYDLCDQSYVLSTTGSRFQHFRSHVGRNLVVSPV